MVTQVLLCDTIGVLWNTTGDDISVTMTRIMFLCLNRYANSISTRGNVHPTTWP
jgi:hypothetical protein